MKISIHFIKNASLYIILLLLQRRIRINRDSRMFILILLTKQQFIESKGVTMRGIFSNPAEQNFLDSYWWNKIKFWRKIICPPKFASWYQYSKGKK